MDLNENIIIELVGANETDKETLIDYFEKKGIEDLFVEYDVLDISEITKMQISNILTILESNSGEK
ncbi:hypothetical protein CIW83_02930 [Tissierella sp. P1]|uniref:hypothetical protein n=1 Tax=Tissierella sp. P1 TaxID=1280483 RepID=UPI000BA02C88|nr:hypothetical protein [Tissierella sp. P1]OZV13517.1 hypothetical protein CIW83_02930 [Tissierella sp. P1]